LNGSGYEKLVFEYTVPGILCRNAGCILIPLTVEFRYPDEYVEPEQEEYKEAFSAAKLLPAHIVTTIF